MIIYKEIVSELENSPFNSMIESGVSPEEIFSSVQSTFDIFFENKNNLSRYSKDFLIHDLINYTKNYYPEINHNISSVISILRCAKAANEIKTFKLLAQLQVDITDISIKMWTYIILQPDFEQLEKYEYVSECFSIIENISETAIKNFFNYLLAFSKLSSNESCNIDTIKNSTFGQVYNELLSSGSINVLVSYFNEPISISQFRNIACHKSYKLIESNILCSYGKNNSKYHIISSKEELLKITQKLNVILQAINFGLKFFVYDNINEIQPYLEKGDLSSDRNETWHLLFTTELFMNGFKVISIEEFENKLVIILQEMTSQNVKIRAAQSSKAIFKAWYYSNARLVKIIYQDINGINIVATSSTSYICEEIASGKQDICYLAENLKVEQY